MDKKGPDESIKDSVKKKNSASKSTKKQQKITTKDKHEKEHYPAKGKQCYSCKKMEPFPVSL